MPTMNTGGTNTGAPTGDDDNFADRTWRTWTTGNTVTYNTTLPDPDGWTRINNNTFFRPTYRPAAYDEWGQEVIERTPGEQAAYEAEQRERQRVREERYDAARREREERTARLAEERRVKAERRNAAAARAKELLRKVLLPAELEHYDRTEEIVVTGSDGRRYKIGSGVVGNVYLLGENDQRLVSMCCHPELSPGSNEHNDDWNHPAHDGLPHTDAHISQILLLRCDAPTFWRGANIDRYHRGTEEENELVGQLIQEYGYGTNIRDAA